MTVLTRLTLASAAFAAGMLLAAAPANAAQPEAPRGGETGTLLMPIIGSGTHPIEDTNGGTAAEFTVAGGIAVGWGVADSPI